MSRPTVCGDSNAARAAEICSLWCVCSNWEVQERWGSHMDSPISTCPSRETRPFTGGVRVKGQTRCLSTLQGKNYQRTEKNVGKKIAETGRIAAGP